MVDDRVIADDWVSGFRAGENGEALDMSRNSNWIGGYQSGAELRSARDVRRRRKAMIVIVAGLAIIACEIALRIVGRAP